jgi:caa(3)-type oxidase subunit IV
MEDSHGSEGQAGPTMQLYLFISVALSVFTAVSFAVNAGVRGGTFSPTTGFTIIMAVAVCKAVLVAMFFMHLKFDWMRLYFLIIPVMVLGVMMVVVLLPDIVLAWHH